MPINNSRVKFCGITSSAFASLSSKDTNTVYFLVDTRDIYVGDVKYSDTSGSNTRFTNVD